VASPVGPLQSISALVKRCVSPKGQLGLLGKPGMHVPHLAAALTNACLMSCSGMPLRWCLFSARVVHLARLVCKSGKAGTQAGT